MATPPEPHAQDWTQEVDYVGFWLRAVAVLLDTVMLSILITLVIFVFYGVDGVADPGQLELLRDFNRFAAAEIQPQVLLDRLTNGYYENFGGKAGPSPLVGLLLNYLVPVVLVILLWVIISTTPGKLVFKGYIVDEKTGQRLTTGQSIIRYLGYFASIFTLGYGFFRVGWNKRKQGLHDKITGTVVVLPKAGSNFKPLPRK